MATNYVDPQVQYVLDNMHTIVASEGGSLELQELSGGRLTVRYNKGVNEDCPECVPTHEMVQMMMKTSLSVHAPYIRQIEVL